MSKPHPSGPATLFLIVGLPGAGKTTRAMELAAAHGALRLTPDPWMIALFDDSMADGRRFVLEGRLMSGALQALRLGVGVVLDYGLWGRDERSALRWLATTAGATGPGRWASAVSVAELPRVTAPQLLAAAVQAAALARGWSARRRRLTRSPVLICTGHAVWHMPSTAQVCRAA